MITSGTNHKQKKRTELRLCHPAHNALLLASNILFLYLCNGNIIRPIRRIRYVHSITAYKLYIMALRKTSDTEIAYHLCR